MSGILNTWGKIKAKAAEKECERRSGGASLPPLRSDISQTPERCQKLPFQLFVLMQAFDFPVTCFTNFPFSVCFKGKMSFSDKSGEINCFCWKLVWKSFGFLFLFFFCQNRVFITYMISFSEEKTCSQGQNTKILIFSNQLNNFEDSLFFRGRKWGVWGFFWVFFLHCCGF